MSMQSAGMTRSGSKREIFLRGYPLIILLVVAFFAADSRAEQNFGYEEVVRIAQDSATQPYKDPHGEVPDFLLNINYDQWRSIRFRPEKALWKAENLPFEVQFFHPGFYYDRIVSINVVEGEKVTPVHFAKEMFDYGNNDFAPKVPENLGFAGFRIHYPINRPNYHDEVAVFLGASYIRAVPKNLVYGLSARGLAIDTAIGSGEEFPYFRTFWLVKPNANAKEMTIFALLDSPSLTGAYSFVLKPGESTDMQIGLSLFTRKAVKKLGIAPLTSMFFYSETTNIRPVDDFRPELHDSDGLLIAYPSGEYVWRPLVNFKHLFINAFEMSNPAGFGVLQRDMNFDHYQDLEARYDKRPSTWIKPTGDWGHGQIELVQIPTDSEKNDNIVAYWKPDLAAGDHNNYNFQYTLSWYNSKIKRRHGIGYVNATRTSAADNDNERKFIIDFKGGQLADLPSKLPADSPLESVISTSGGGEVVEKQLFRNDPGNSWRLVFKIRRKEKGPLEKVIPATSDRSPIEIRAYLKQGGKVQSETWSYAWQ